MSTSTLRKAIDALLAAFNSADADMAITLFSPDTVIDDPSTGHRSDGHAAPAAGAGMNKLLIYGATADPAGWWHGNAALSLLTQAAPIDE